VTNTNVIIVGKKIDKLHARKLSYLLSSIFELFLPWIFLDGGSDVRMKPFTAKTNSPVPVGPINLQGLELLD
jgi:hypothetical protein